MSATGDGIVLAVTSGAWVVLASVASVPALANTDKLAYGKHLSQECTTCHRHDGADKGIPSIVGLEPEFFVTTLKFYQTGARANPTMNSVAQTLNDEQIQALAAYFSTLKSPSKQVRSARKK